MQRRTEMDEGAEPSHRAEITSTRARHPRDDARATRNSPVRSDTPAHSAEPKIIFAALLPRNAVLSQPLAEGEEAVYTLGQVVVLAIGPVLSPRRLLADLATSGSATPQCEALLRGKGAAAAASVVAQNQAPGDYRVPVQTPELNQHESSIQLTKREQTILLRLAEGLEEKEIAREERIGQRTVERTICALKEKLAASTNFTLAIEACRLGLLQ